MKSEICHVCIAPKSSRRFKAWEKVLNKHNQLLKHITYLDIIKGSPLFSKGIKYYVRIESPGEDTKTYKRLRLLGCKNSSEQQRIRNESENYGQVADFNRWYRGWCTLLLYLDKLSTIYDISFLNDPMDIIVAFDKQHTQNGLTHLGIKGPQLLGKCTSYASLIEQLQEQRISQVFIKPTYGSSASGIMAFRFINNEKQALYTTIKIKDDILYNSLKIQKYTDIQTIVHIINTMTSSDLIIQKWIPKWNHKGYSFDFRVVCIKKDPVFIIARGSKNVITNLHLGNKKMTITQSGISEGIVKQLKKVASDVMSYGFPSFSYAGIDILVDRSGEIYVIEVNPFGDLLLGIKNEFGRTVYEEEYASLFA